MKKVFISYDRKSEATVTHLVDDIQALGFTVWFDHDLSGGQAWWDQILVEIRACDVFLFVLNPNSINSTPCKREYGYAAELGKPILPVLVADGVSVDLLPPELTKIHFVDHRQQDRSAALRLARALTALPSPQPLPDPLPAPPEVPISYIGTIAEKIDLEKLSESQQKELVFELKRVLRKPESIHDARTLLEKFRERRDLLAPVADEIDEVLASSSIETSSSAREGPPVAFTPTSMSASSVYTMDGRTVKLTEFRIEALVSWVTRGIIRKGEDYKEVSKLYINDGFKKKVPLSECRSVEILGKPKEKELIRVKLERINKGDLTGELMAPDYEDLDCERSLAITYTPQSKYRIKGLDPDRDEIGIYFRDIRQIVFHRGE